MPTEDPGPESLVLRLLRAMDAKLDSLRADKVEIKERLGILEARYAGLSRRVDRMGGEIEQITKRLGLIEA